MSTDRVAVTDGRVPDLERQLEDHQPLDRIEFLARRRTLRLLRWLERPFDENADPTHVTGSAIVFDAAGNVLLHRHKRLGVWLQPGGHVDGREHVMDAARREVLEETGVVTVGCGELVHVDVHQGPRGHVHLDVRFAFDAAPRAVISPGPGESPDVAWRDPAVTNVLGDRSLTAAVQAALGTRADRRTRVRTDAGGAPPRRAVGPDPPRPSRSPAIPPAPGPGA